MPREVHIVGRRIREELRRRGETLSWLAKRSHLSVSALSLLASGRTRQPLASTLEQVARGLEMTVAELLGRSEAATTSESVLRVPLVRWNATEGYYETGAFTVVPGSTVSGHGRVKATLIEGSGLAPHVLPGDIVFFDPDEPLTHGAVFLLVWRDGQYVAYYVDPAEGPSPVSVVGPSFLLQGTVPIAHDGEVAVIGRVISISRKPPTLNAHASLPG